MAAVLGAVGRDSATATYSIGGWVHGAVRDKPVPIGSFRIGTAMRRALYILKWLAVSIAILAGVAGATEQLANQAQTTLNGAIDNSVTSIVVTSASHFPTQGTFSINVCVQNGTVCASNQELMTVTAVSGTTFTVTRAEDSNFPAVSHANGELVTAVLTARGAAQLEADAAQLTAVADINSSFQVTATHLTNALPYNQGGTACKTTTFGTLPGSPTVGTTCFITDSASGCLPGTAVTAGSGATACRVDWNGANWMPAGAAQAASGSPTGTAGGDLTGNYPNPGVGQVNSGLIPLSAAVVGTNGSRQFVADSLQGNGAKVQLSTGTTTTNDLVKFDANGNTVDSGTTGSNLTLAGSSGNLQTNNGSGNLGAYAGSTCTNKAVTALNASGTATCTTLTSSYVDNTIALTGTDINTSNQVTVTHLAAALPVNQGGSGAGTFTAHGLLLGEGTSAFGDIVLTTAHSLLVGAGASADPVATNAIPTCGDATHALKYDQTTDNWGCQAITASATAAGSTGAIQYNNAGALGGVVISSALVLGNGSSAPSAYAGTSGAANQWVTAISANGTGTFLQPNFTNLAGNIATSQMNSGTGATSSTFWRGDGTWAALPASSFATAMSSTTAMAGFGGL